VTDLLVLNRVSKSFGGLEAITELSLTVPVGAIVAVIGANGAGKTTLFDLITGACRPDRGRITFNGRGLVGLRADQVCAAGIARTFNPVQSFGALSVVDTVVVAALLRASGAAEARLRALELLELLDLARVARQPANRLTLAERKRLELARALATQPHLLLLDELLAELAPADIERIGTLLQAFNRRPGLTLILAEARLNTALAFAHRVVVLDHGRVVADADPAALVDSVNQEEAP